MPVVKQHSLNWETLTCTATYQLKRKWQANLKVYLHCVLGQGCSGKVYLGSDSVGKMFAHSDRDGAYPDPDKVVESTICELKRRAEQEAVPVPEDYIHA